MFLSIFVSGKPASAGRGGTSGVVCLKKGGKKTQRENAIADDVLDKEELCDTFSFPYTQGKAKRPQQQHQQQHHQQQ